MKSSPVRERVPDGDAIALFRDRPGFWLTLAGSSFLALYAERLRPLDLRPTWGIALAIILERPGVSQSALARDLRINRASAMALANTLEALGYIERRSQDGRNRMALAITELGRERLLRACAIEQALVAEIMGGIDANAMSVFVETLKDVTVKASRADGTTRGAG